MALALKTLEAEIDRTGVELLVGDLPVVMAEQTHLACVFENLLSNALKYQVEGRDPKLSVSAERTARGEWRFAVADNGIGIEPQYREKIFEIFQRLDPASETQGTGIGLTLCRRIIHHFGGDIWVESEPGRGTTVNFTLRDGRAPCISRASP